MWVFTRTIDGHGAFLSAVQHRDDEDQLMVRGRRKQDLEHAFPGRAPLETPDGDYRWRLTVTKLEFAELMASLVDAIDYDNVKNAMGDDHELHDAMMTTWSAMYRMQQRDLDGDDDDDEEDDDEWLAKVIAHDAGVNPFTVPLYDDDELEPDTNPSFDDEPVVTGEPCVDCGEPLALDRWRDSRGNMTNEWYCPRCELDDPRDLGTTWKPTAIKTVKAKSAKVNELESALAALKKEVSG